MAEAEHEVYLHAKAEGRAVARGEDSVKRWEQVNAELVDAAATLRAKHEKQAAKVQSLKAPEDFEQTVGDLLRAIQESGRIPFIKWELQAKRELVLALLDAWGSLKRRLDVGIYISRVKGRKTIDAFRWETKGAGFGRLRGLVTLERDGREYVADDPAWDLTPSAAARVAAVLTKHKPKPFVTTKHAYIRVR